MGFCLASNRPVRGISDQTERAGSEEPCAIFRAACHVDCDSVASSSLEHGTAIYQTTRSSWAKNPFVGRIRSSLALGRRLERCGMEKLHSLGGRRESDSVLYLAGLLQYAPQARTCARATRCGSESSTGKHSSAEVAKPQLPASGF